MNNSNIAFIGIGAYIVFTILLYFVIFNKHHKRNKVELDELVELFTKFFTLTTISILMIVCGMYLFINAAKYRYELQEAIGNLILGIFIISATIINYISYLRKSLEDYNQEAREVYRKNNFKLGQTLLLIMLILLTVVPLAKIPGLLSKLEKYKEQIYIEIAKQILISISSLFLLININPLGFKEKIFKKKEEKEIDIK